VAKGLAIECGRRFYTEGQGDFKAVTYNRLCLVFRGDEGETVVRPFKARFPMRMPDAGLDETEEGVLLNSASVLSGLVDRPLRWRVGLPKPPRRRLQYYFLRSSFDPDDVANLQNIDTRVETPPGTSFASSIDVELLVKEDGTTVPTFVYGHGALSGQEVHVEGRPCTAPRLASCR
jgi:hypothetical protein